MLYNNISSVRNDNFFRTITSDLWNCKIVIPDTFLQNFNVLKSSSSTFYFFTYLRVSLYNFFVVMCLIYVPPIRSINYVLGECIASSFHVKPPKILTKNRSLDCNTFHYLQRIYCKTFIHFLRYLSLSFNSTGREIHTIANCTFSMKQRKCQTKLASRFFWPWLAASILPLLVDNTINILL